MMLITRASCSTSAQVETLLVFAKVGKLHLVHLMLQEVHAVWQSIDAPALFPQIVKAEPSRLHMSASASCPLPSAWTGRS